MGGNKAYLMRRTIVTLTIKIRVTLEKSLRFLSDFYYLYSP